MSALWRITRVAARPPQDDSFTTGLLLLVGSQRGVRLSGRSQALQTAVMHCLGHVFGQNFVTAG